MSNAKYQPRHRQVRRPIVPIAALTDTMTSMTSVRPVAAASVSGLALTAMVAGPVAADPVQTAEETSTVPATIVATNLPTTVAVPDLVWSAADTVAVSAEAPAPIVDEEVPVSRTQARANAPRPVASTNVASAEDRQAAAYAEIQASEAATSVAEAPGAEAPAAEAPASSRGQQVVAIAKQYLGVWYRFGGTTPAGFDCSGLVKYVYAQVGINLPRTSHGQGRGGVAVSMADAQPGDIVYYSSGHVAIYIGGGMHIEAPTSGQQVKISPVRKYTSIRRHL